MAEACQHCPSINNVSGRLFSHLSSWTPSLCSETSSAGSFRAKPILWSPFDGSKSIGREPLLGFGQSILADAKTESTY